MVGIQLAGDEIKHPKTQQGKRALEQRAPQLHENTKKSVFVRGGNTSGKVNTFLKDLYQLKKPDAVLMKRFLIEKFR